MNRTQPIKLKKQIISALSPCFVGLGPTQISDNLFWLQSPDLIRMVQVTFLNNNQASYFGSTTASFSVEFGGLYGSAKPFENQKDFPGVHFCQVRGKLHRDIQQEVPNKNLHSAEHHRRDIWWVEANGNNVNEVIESVARVAKMEMSVWLERLSDYNYILRYLFWKDEDDYGLYGFGRKGSLARTRLIDIVSGKFPNQSWLKWRMLLPGRSA